MTAQSWNKLTVPVGTDGWNLVTHLLGMANTANVLVKVNDQTERDGLAALAPGGVLPIPTQVYRVDLDSVETWNGSAWKRTDSAETSADVATFSTGWTALTGAHKPRVRKTGNRVVLIGGVTSSASAGANILTVPAAFQPPTTSTRFVGTAITSNASTVTLALSAGVLSIPAGYGNINAAVTQNVPLVCSWWMD